MIKQAIVIATSVLLSTGVAWSNTSSSNTNSNGGNVTETTSQYFSDSDITARIKADFLTDSDIKSLSISVATDKGVVTLEGTVENSMQRKKAVKLATHVNGVKSVKDKLVIKAAQ